MKVKVRTAIKAYVLIVMLNIIVSFLAHGTLNKFFVVTGLIGVIYLIVTIDIYEQFIQFGKYREAGIKFWEYGLTEQAKNQFRLSGDEILIELIDKCSQTNNKDLNIDIVKYFDDVKDNKIAQSFIIETVKKDIKTLKSSFTSIKENFKKGRM